MTVSIQKPNWRAVQTIGERIGVAFTRMTHLGAPGPSAGADATKATEWSAVMTGAAPAAPATGRGGPAHGASARGAATSRARTASRARAVLSTARRQRPELNSAWLLPVMLLVVCAVATGWLFASGTAAAVWLVALVGVALAGIPLALVVLRIFGYEDPD